MGSEKMKAVNLGKPIRMSQVAEDLGVHRATVWRWVRDGVMGERLQGRRIGKDWYTSEAALKLFLRKLNNQTPDPTRGPGSGKDWQNCSDRKC